jgi:hypothetical protein
MATFHGPINLHLGSEPVWAASEYDHETHDYVVEVTGADLKKFRAVADGYGFVETSVPEPVEAPKEKASAKVGKDA